MRTMLMNQTALEFRPYDPLQRLTLHHRTHSQDTADANGIKHADCRVTANSLSASPRGLANRVLAFFGGFSLKLHSSSLMAVKSSKAQKKVEYQKKMCRLLEEYSQILIVGADHVRSKQLQDIRRGVRGHSVVLMGKNTMMKRSLRLYAESTGNMDLLTLVPFIVGKVGLIFTKGDLKEVSEEVSKYKVGGLARAGVVSPIDIVIKPGSTGLDPSNTSFFQALNIPTKINKGAVEILVPVELVKKGEKVGTSEATLLAKLDKKPFSYALVVLFAYQNGSVFSPKALHLTDQDLADKFSGGVSMIVSLSLAISYPTLAVAPHMFVNAYNNVLAVAMATAYSFPQAQKVEECLKEDEGKIAVAMAPVAAAKEED